MWQTWLSLVCINHCCTCCIGQSLLSVWSPFLMLIETRWRYQSATACNLRVVLLSLLLGSLVISHVQTPLMDASAWRCIWWRWLVTLNSYLRCIFLLSVTAERMNPFLRSRIWTNYLLNILLMVVLIVLLIGVVLNCCVCLRIVHRWTILASAVQVSRVRSSL